MCEKANTSFDFGVLYKCNLGKHGQLDLATDVAQLLHHGDPSASLCMLCAQQRRSQHFMLLLQGCCTRQEPIL